LIVVIQFELLKSKTDSSDIYSIS